MSITLLLVQTLNGLQLGVLLFLIAAGLTLVFGVMDFINLAHGVQYMLGAYFAVMFYALSGNFFVALVLALVAALAFGLLLEFSIFRHLYDRDHLDQVIATFGIIIFLNQAVKLVWGAAPLTLPMPEIFSGSVSLMPGLIYPIWRLVIITSGLAVAALLYGLVTYTRVGMLVRAGATNASMVSALGVDIRRLFMIVFGFGTMLAAFAGVMIAPILSVEPGMGDTILILAFVVIVIGGVGSIRGAFVASILVGLIDTIGRAFVPDILRSVLSASSASTLGPALASMLIYMLMAGILVFRPEGLFPAATR
jgi:branched-chain amino acid transport system permease protein